MKLEDAVWVRMADTQSHGRMDDVIYGSRSESAECCSLTWGDETLYEDGQDDGGTWTCVLEFDDGEWTYDYAHSCRGGPQLRNGLDCDGDPAKNDEAQVEPRKALVWMLEEHKHGVAEYIAAQAKYAAED